MEIISKENLIPIVFITDNNFVMQTSVAITSLIENRGSTQYKIFIIGAKLSENNKKALKNMERNDCIIEIIDGDIKKIKNLHKYNVKGQGHYLSASEAALFKFDLPNLLPKYEKVIYIDGDTIILNNLKDLYNTSLENNYVAAAHDTGKIYFKHKFVLECPEYFNSGVMLLNLNLMRKNNITDKLIETKLNLTDSNLMDQNVLNIVFKNRIKIIDIKYNFLVLNLERAQAKWKIEDINQLFDSKYTDLQDIKNKACIIHFSSKDKPWKYSNVTYSEYWYKYYLKSPFGTEKLNRKILPKVSVIIPIYNSEKYLTKCLDSIISQSLEDIEIICIDDCSTDSSLKILKNYEQKDRRIKIIANTKNMKQGGARNKGLEFASAPYVMFVDADDYLTLDAIESFYTTIINNDSDIVISHVENFLEDTANDDILTKLTSYYEQHRKNNGKYNVESVLEYRTGPVAKLFKKDILDKNNIKFPENLIQEDEAFHWAYFSRISSLYFLEKAYYYRRVHSCSTMVQRENNNIGILDMIKILDIIYSDLKRNKLFKKYKNDYLNYYYSHKQRILSKITDKKLAKKVKKRFNKLENKIFYTPVEKIFSIKNNHKKTHKIISILGLKIKIKRNCLEKIFSVKNDDIRKVITILGLKFKFKSQKLVVRKQQEEMRNSINYLIEQNKKFDNQFNRLYNQIKIKNENKVLNFKTIQNLTNLIRNNINILPNDIDLIVGIPRSGIIPAYLIGLFMNKNICSINEFINNLIPQKGERPISVLDKDKNEKIKVLIVDDSIYSGNALKKTKEQLLSINTNKYDIKYCAIYTKGEVKDKVDYYFEIVSPPRMFQWNYLNHSNAKSCCYDIDGVLCVDPTPEQNDDGEKYIDFILNAKPLFIPSYEINSLVTSRLEKYRSQTEEWLRKHNVKYRNLYMLNLESAEERRRLGCHAKFKAEIFQKKEDCLYFIESEREQAKKIAELTGKQVICVTTDEYFGG